MTIKKYKIKSFNNVNKMNDFFIDIYLYLKHLSLLIKN